MNKKILIFILVFVLLSAAASASNLTVGLISHWTFDDADRSGTATFDVHGPVDLTDGTAPTKGAAGKLGESFSYAGGSSQYIHNQTANIIYNNMQEMTVNQWIKHAHGAYGVGFTITDFSEDEFYYSQIDTAGGIGHGFYDGGYQIAVANSGSHTSNEWVMFTLIINSTGNYRYINGSLVGSDASTYYLTSVADVDRICLGVRCKNNAYATYITGSIDETSIWNISLEPDQIGELWNSGAGLAYTSFENPSGVQPSTDISLTITDDFNGSSIQTFSTLIDWGNGTTNTYETSNGTVIVHNISNVNLTVNISYINMTTYFNKTMQNVLIVANTTNTVTNTTYQAVACFNATEKITGDSLTPDNTTLLSNVSLNNCFNISASTYNVMASLNNYNTKNQSVTIPALSNATYTIENMSSLNLTVFARDALSGAYLNNYQLNLTSINVSGWAGEHHANTANQTFNLINGTYNIIIDLDGYALTDAETNVSATSDTNVTFYLYPTNSLNITFYDEGDNTALSGPNVSFEIILNDANASAGWTTNSTYWIDNLDAGNYEIRYRATGDGYGERSYYFNLTNRTYNALSLYLLNNTATESITTTLYDEYGNKLEGYVIRLLRYYADVNGYLVVDEGQTNAEGQTVLTAIRNGPYYKFRIVNGAGEVLKTTSSTQIYDTSISLYVTLGEDIGETLENLNDVSYQLTWLNSSDQFRFTWDAASGLLVSVTTYVYEVDNLNGDTLYNSSTSASASGTMYVGVLRQNDTTYKALSYVTFAGETEDTLLDSLTVTFDETIVVFGKLGLYLTFLIVVVLALTGLWNPAVPCILVPVGLMITRIARLHALEWTWIIAITAVAAIIMFIIRDKT